MVAARFERVGQLAPFATLLSFVTSWSFTDLVRTAAWAVGDAKHLCLLDRAFCSATTRRLGGWAASLERQGGAAVWRSRLLAKMEVAPKWPPRW